MAEQIFEAPKTSGQIREIAITKTDFEADPSIVVVTERGNLGEYDGSLGVFHPEGAMAVEDFLEGETCRWAFFHAEFQYIIKGKAKMTYTLAPWHDDVKSIIVGTGDAYMIPTGADITWEVFPGAPFRKLCVTMPAEPMYQTVPLKKVVPYAEYYKNKKGTK